VINFNFIV
jgi:hypothetical protein